MIFTLGIFLYVFRIKQDVFELAFAIHLALIIEIRGLGIAAVTSGQYALGLFPWTKRDGGGEAVATVAIDAFGIKRKSIPIKSFHKF